MEPPENQDGPHRDEIPLRNARGEANSVRFPLSAHEWEASFTGTMSLDGKFPTLDLKISCLDLKPCEGVVIMLRIESLPIMPFYFSGNESSMMIRQLCVAKRKPENLTEVYIDDMLPIDISKCVNAVMEIDWHRDDSGQIVITSKFMEGDVVCLSFSFHFCAFLLLHRSMFSMNWPFHTYRTMCEERNVKVKVEWFDKMHPQLKIRKLLKDLNTMPTDDFQLLRGVLGSYYHEFYSMKNYECYLLTIRYQALKFGLDLLPKSATLFKLFASKTCCEIINMRIVRSTFTWQNSLETCVKIGTTDRDQIVWEEEVKIEGTSMSIVLCIHVETFDEQEYLSFGAVLIGLLEIQQLSIKVKSDEMDINEEIENIVTPRIVTLGIPTLFKLESSFERDISIKFDLKIEPVTLSELPSEIVMPGVTDYVFTAGETRFKINKQLLSHRLPYFKGLFQFESGEKDEMSVDYNPATFFNLLKFVYYGSICFKSVAECAECVVMTNAMVCNEIEEACIACVRHNGTSNVTVMNPMIALTNSMFLHCQALTDIMNSEKDQIEKNISEPATVDDPIAERDVPVDQPQSEEQPLSSDDEEELDEEEDEDDEDDGVEEEEAVASGVRVGLEMNVPGLENHVVFQMYGRNDPRAAGRNTMSKEEYTEMMVQMMVGGSQRVGGSEEENQEEQQRRQ
ncbi:unnamed protein product [Caenorhabditis sp. 36 PRJEB53466]|nr:unnamed protein product [Caenorhabditis sp. 36 PRJEB53466]